MAVIEVRAAWILRLSGLLVAVVPMAAVAAAKATPAVEDGAVVLSVTSSGRSADELRNAADGWTGLEEAPLHLNLTPPIYEGDPVDDGARPVAWVTLGRIPPRVAPARHNASRMAATSASTRSTPWISSASQTPRA
jgi:hypothetical protein